MNVYCMDVGQVQTGVHHGMQAFIIFAWNSMVMGTSDNSGTSADRPEHTPTF